MCRNRWREGARRGSPHPADTSAEGLRDCTGSGDLRSGACGGERPAQSVVRPVQSAVPQLRHTACAYYPIAQSGTCQVIAGARRRNRPCAPLRVTQLISKRLVRIGLLSRLSRLRKLSFSPDCAICQYFQTASFVKLSRLRRLPEVNACRQNWEMFYRKFRAAGNK